MVVELGLPAILPGALVGLHYAIQVFRPRLGYGSDVGGRRTRWIVGGMAILALGAILAAGMSGLDRALVLPPALAQDPSTLDEDVRPALLPRSLGDAIDRFQERATALWSNVLSPTYAELLVTLRRAELAYYGSLEKRDDRVKQLLKRY